MKSLTIDASAILNLLEQNPDGNCMRLLCKHALQEKLIINAPTFILVEVMNVLLKKKKFSKDQVDEFIKQLMNTNIHFSDFLPHQIGDLLQIATRYGITAYDAQYVLLADTLQSTLITEDKELLAINGLCMSIHEYSIGS